MMYRSLERSPKDPQDGIFLYPGRLCGSLTSNSTFSSYNETLIVRFVTDGSVTARGFIARYTVIPHGK